MSKLLSDESARVLLASMDARERAERASAMIRASIQRAQQVRIDSLIVRVAAQSSRAALRAAIATSQQFRTAKVCAPPE